MIIEALYIRKAFLKFTFTILTLILMGCKAPLNYLNEGDINSAIYNAVIDFDHNHKDLQKKHSVFIVVFFENEIEEHDFYHLTIIGEEDKFLYNKLNIQNSPKIPSNYLEIGNNIYIWYDDKKLDNITIETFKKYNLLVDNEDGKIKFYGDVVINEKQKGVTYFICKNDITSFEKKVSNLYVKFPKKLNCFGNNP